MMMRYTEELAGRREILIQSCAAQRQALTMQGHAVMAKLSAFDMGLTVAERLKKNPAWIAVLVVGLVAIKPRRLLTVLQTGLLAWQAARTLAPTLKNIIECRTHQ
jgi:uncharacterized membrane protein YhfC